MEITKTLNLTEAKALFEANAVLYGGQDYIPQKRAEELLGETAVDFEVDCGEPQKNRSMHTYKHAGKEYELILLTWGGFSLCVTWHNIEILEKDGKYSEVVD